MPITADVDLTVKDISGLASVDAIASFLTRLGYRTECRQALPLAAFGLSPETTDAIRHMELLAEDAQQELRVIFVQLRSVTAKARNEIARNLGRRAADHMLILTKDFEAIEFVLIDKETRQNRGPTGPTVAIIPRTVTVDRKYAGLEQRRVLRRLTWTGKDGLDQFDKLRSVFESAYYSGRYFQNRALFADHYLETRLREDAAWRDNPTEAFLATKSLLKDARARFANKGEQVLRDELFDPIWKLLGFKGKTNKSAKQDHLEPDYVLNGQDGNPSTVAFVYRWDRWLDGPDLNDVDTPDENPGAAVVSALAEGKARWIIVTNGRFWRLYSKDAHSRSTNFYEIDLEEALVASDETDPNEAFRYWWLFFRREAFESTLAAEQPSCWLDTVVQGSRDYAKRLGDRLKVRIFVEIFPHLSQGFLHDRKKRLGIAKQPTDIELRDAFEATLTLLYRLLFLLYAESRDLLPIREAAYKNASLQKIKEEIAIHAGVAESAVAERLKAFSETDTTLYDRLLKLFAVMDKGDSILNVPCYNGGLFITEPSGNLDEREHRIAKFLMEHKVPDRFLALAIDRLSRDQDEKTLGLVFIDYKSLEVRHLGSIYEGLLEFKLKVAQEDLATKTEKKKETYIPLSQVKVGRGKKAAASAVVRKGEVYLSNDKSERKASGSYYTPDPIVEYIVEHTVGPVLQEKLDGLREDLSKASKTYHRHLTNAKHNAGLIPNDMDARAFAASKAYAEHRRLVDQVFDMKVLDPAMGSGHFLVEAVDFITDRLLDFLNRFPHNPVQFALDRTRRSILEALTEQSVTVDPEKLTDINLLKRHVLKRCIYGVDLNPMAVELAKVSLWLDAFTLGAPLSFLDHHLRCGNSLIGATFDDLRKATEGQLFAVDYEPLLRAIRHVLFVNEMADATAAEVHQSADVYSQARKDLSGYQIVLDLLVADHFIDKGVKPSALITLAQEINLSSRSALLSSLDAESSLLVANVENLARTQRFFHWEIEFPEAFFGFVGPDEREIRHKNDIRTGSAGFESVFGNPPYDVLKKERGYLAANAQIDYFRTVPTFAPAIASVLNLYRLFLTRILTIVQSVGIFGNIVPMALLSDASAAGLRKLLFDSTDLRILDAFPQKDDPANRVFPEAKLSTLVLCGNPHTRTETLRVRVHPGRDLVLNSPTLSITVARVRAFDPRYCAVPLGLPNDVTIMAQLLESNYVSPAATLMTVMVGEVDMTNDRDVVSSSHTQYELIKGAHIQPYYVRERPKQGSQEWINEASYISKYRGSPKERVYKRQRAMMQGISGTDDSRRIKAAMSRTGDFLANSVNWLVATNTAVCEWFLLAWLNSSITEWRFRLTSTNNNVNNYEIESIPIPVLPDKRDSDKLQPSALVKEVDSFLDNKSTAEQLVQLAHGCSRSWEVHDQIANLSRKLTDLVEQFQFLKRDFREEVMSVLGIRSEDEFSNLPGKTIIEDCVPDYRSQGEVTSFDDLITVVRKSRRRFAREPSESDLRELQPHYLKSVEARLCIRAATERVDLAIDLVLGGACGLGSEQINWIRSRAICKDNGSEE